MGVPGLWPFLSSIFRKHVIHFEKNTQTHEFDYVYLDANGLLHAAAQKIFNYGNKKRIRDPYSKSTYNEKIIKVYEAFIENLTDVISMIVPKEVLYIALDGPAPRAKQNQQRERRFIAAKMRDTNTSQNNTINNITNDNIINNDIINDQTISYPIKQTSLMSGTSLGGNIHMGSYLGVNVENTISVQFDSSSITPGTEFSHNLSQYMYYIIRKKMNDVDDLWNKVKIIYSPTSVPGEGEHNCMDYIRNLDENTKRNKTHCMFGPDGDLLMLTLVSRLNNIFLFREDIKDSLYYDLVNMGSIRNELAYPFKLNKSLICGGKPDDLANDFVFIGFFVGNDFLPKIKMFHRLDRGLNKMISIYSDLTDYGRHNVLTYKGNLLMDGVKLFVKKLKEFELEFISEQAIVDPPEEKFIDYTLLNNAKINEDPVTKKRTVVYIDMKSYRKDYYNKAGIIGNNGEFSFEIGVKEMCKNYFKMLVWVFLYYTKTLQSWSYFYAYNYAPFMSDLYLYVNSLNETDYLTSISVFDLSEPSLPFIQLLSVLPPQSSKLLPEQFEELLTSKMGPLSIYHPSTFHIDYEGKTQEHQGVAILKFVDYSTVLKAYNYINDKLEWKWHRNEFGKDCIFEYIFSHRGGTVFDSEFESIYGTLKNCHVSVKYI